MRCFLRKSLLLQEAFTQSVTSRLKTSRYGDFSQFFESIVLGLKNFGLEKISVSVLKKNWSQKKVSVLVSKILVSKKVSVADQKNWSQKSLSNNLKNLFLKKVVELVSKTLDLVMVSKSLVSQLLQICPTCPTMNNMSEMSTMLQKSRKCLFNFTF